MELQLRPQLLLLLTVMMETAAASPQNLCSNQTLIRTRSACHPCTILALMGCPAGYRRSPRPPASDCKRIIRTPSMEVPINGCSFECYKEAELRRCCPGYWGPDCMECPDSAERPCSGRGLCSEGLGGNGTCSCQDGFGGTACQDCMPDRYGPTCSSVCSCVHGLCNSGLTGDGRCTCFSGYKGPYCDRELPACAALRCQENARCMEEALSGQLVCQCQPGYAASGAQCVSINPCLRQVCHAHASCVHTGPDRHLCTCLEGYRGDGRVCMALDPCQSHAGGCSPGSALCVYDGPGKSHCECLPGFQQLSAGRCSLQDACRPDSCHKDANCSTVEPGRVQCTCLPGFVGNGKTCFGNIMQRLVDMNTEPGGQWSGQLSSALTLFSSLAWPLKNLGPFTVFVPINKGFRGTSLRTLTADASKAEYLSNMHLVAGVMSFDSLKKSDVFYTLMGKPAEVDTSEGDSLTKIRVHGSRKKGVIVQADVVASNGVIHVLNRLMDGVPPTVDAEPQENLMKILNGYGKFETFRSLLEKASLVSVVDGPGPLTVFAPSGEAFSSMAEGHLQYLSSPEGHNKLLEFLRNHIVSSASLTVHNLVSRPRVQTTANQILTINVTDNGQVLVNGAAVLEAGVEAKNGRLYVLDGVLTPASIEPLLPHRCDITETRTVTGECVRCSQLKLHQCASGVFTGSSALGCSYTLNIGDPPLKFKVRGCAPLCNVTLTTPACCKGFFGPDCTACPGGFQTPCSGHGQCSEGTAGDGLCTCEENFGGSRCHYCVSPNKYGPKCDKTCPCVHGRCDNRPDSAGQCEVDTCLPGFTGRLCDRRTAACGGADARFCHAHADCDYSQGTARCVCQPGFQGDGITCVESDPCAPPLRGGCSVNAKCIKTGPGTHSCQCLSGWTEDGDGCRPINNCHGAARGGCHPNATCIYVGPGQSDCACKPGYRGDGQSCEPVNECVSADGGCHYLASCLRSASGWKCVCDEGYAGDGRVCYGNMEQELLTLQDAADFYTWTTASGLSSSLLDSDVTVLVPSTDAVSKMSSEDRTFWTASGNLPSLVRNHLISGVWPLARLSAQSAVTSLLSTQLAIAASGETTTVAGATIVTPNIGATNGLIHVIDRVLVPDRKSSTGLLATLAVRPEFSLFRSALIEHNLTAEIEQTEQFTVFAPTDAAVAEFLRQTSAAALDANVTRYHVVPALSLLRSDLQLGGYRRSLLGSSFQLGIYPRDGKVFVNDAQVNVSNILSGCGVIHGLTAVLPVLRNRCDLVTYKSLKGACVDCLFHQNKICPSDTVPDKSAKLRNCMLTRVSEGKRVTTIGCVATCLRKNVTARCCAGFFGPHCEPCPGAAGRPCLGNGRCEDGTDGAGVCRCSDGFNGTACETCRDGRYGVHCDQDCLCQNGRCSEGLQGDGTCECDVGWRGVHCDQKIESRADELCGSWKCHSSANCVIPPSGPECRCAAGFTGNGTFCAAVDPCQADNGGCSANAVCKRTRPGRRDCACNRGYAGDGLVCVEINPCLEGNGGCHADADCVHVGPNRTSCVCRDGYTGDGRNCSVTDLCRTKNGGCHRFARCNTTAPGERDCRCLPGFVGDGERCKGSVQRELGVRGLRNFHLSVIVAEVSLQGRGPFTVFVPNAEALSKRPQSKLMRSKGPFMNHVRSHIVMCHTLLPSDLSQPRNLTSLSGHLLTTGSVQGTIFVNHANVTQSDDVSVNGIIHEINRILNPPDASGAQGFQDTSKMNLTDVAELHGYKAFYKLLEDTGVMDAVDDASNQPLTLLLPTDGAVASLPPLQRDFLFHPDNRPHLLEYLKYHVIPDQHVYAEDLVYLDPARTLQGSSLSFSCGGMDDMGGILVNGGPCRVVQRHMSFRGGVAYGIDCLLAPPSLGGRCDQQSSLEVTMNCGSCGASSIRCPSGYKRKEVQKCDLPTMHVAQNAGCRSICRVNMWTSKCCQGYYGRDCLECPGGARSPCGGRGKCDDGHLGNGTCACEAGFVGGACERCGPGRFGPTCRACNCSEHGACEDGRRGTGTCFCEDGWTGDRCDVQQTEVFLCSPPCSPKAACRDNNTCVCRPFYEGDGYTCTAVDVCNIWNGGCAKGAKCSQSGETVSCTCPRGHSGDGFTCRPVDPCTAGDNGGCHQHATCTMMAPGRKKCTCKDAYIGDGVSCELKQLPISRCLQDNGGCHLDATCTDLHYEDATLGVFHYRSDRGQYRLTYAAAQQACSAEGGDLATYTQLSYAQQGGLNMCSAGWLAGARVSYPTTYSSPNCGFGHVGLVDYGVRKNLSETWDAFCYRMKEVQCECQPGYLGNGLSCTGNLLQVLRSTPSFSNFLTQILSWSAASESGRQFVRRLSNATARFTLFVPDNGGLPSNQTLSQRDMEFHLSEGRAVPLGQLKNGSLVRTRVGSLRVLGVADLLDPSVLASRYINDQFVTDSDIPASNGIIHVLQGPLKAPPPHHQMAAAHRAGLGVGVVLLLLVAGAALLVGYRFYAHSAKPFRFHYFKDEDEEEDAPKPSGSRSVSNPVYEAGPTAEPTAAPQEDRQAVDLLQAS